MRKLVIGDKEPLLVVAAPFGLRSASPASNSRRSASGLGRPGTRRNPAPFALGQGAVLDRR